MNLSEINKDLFEVSQSVSEELLIEGINDPYIFKAVFMAGGPGSGKSFLAKQMFGGMGLKFSSSDIPFEHLLKKRGLSFVIDPEQKELFAKQTKTRGYAKELSGKREALWLDGMLGLIVDGTGRDYKKIKRQAAVLKAAGYDVGMVFVNTSLEVALKRNRERARVLKDGMVENMWRQVQSNMGHFQRVFGAQNFFIVDNNKNLGKAEIQKLGRTIRRIALKWAGKPIQNPVGKNIVVQLQATGGKTIADLRQASQIAASRYIDFVNNCLAE